VAVWYLDSENEITEAVARLRGATDEQVVFVVPPGSRIATGRINFKLLAREAGSRGLHLAIASPDEQVRAMATSGGLLALPSVAEAQAALERGDEVGQESEDTGGSETVTTAVTARAEALPPSRTFLARNARRITAAAVGVMTIAVVAVVASLQALPTARIVLTPRTAALGPIAVTVTALPGLAEPDPGALQVPAVSVPVPLAVEGAFPASGSQTSQARARGRVVFSAPPERQGLDIPALTGVGADGVEFRTIESAFLRPTADGSAAEAIVSIEAVRNGPEGNVPAGAIDSVPSLEAQGIRVTNPEPTAGGRFEESPVVTREDYDAAAVDLRNRLAGALTTYQQDPTGVPEGLTVFPETAKPGDVVFDPPAEELVGAAADEFLLTGTMAARVLAVDESEVGSVIASTLADEAPVDMAIVPTTLVIDTGKGVVAGDSVRFEGHARATAQQVIDEAEIVARLAGKPVSEARAILEDLGASTVSVWPEFLGDLPGDRSRIRLEVRAPSTTE
jgi:hypothetical protein